MKDKTKKILQITILILIIVLGTCFIGYKNVEAYPTEGNSSDGYSREIFSEDKTSLNWDTVPVNIFSDKGISLWCMEKGRSIKKYLTASEAYRLAYEAGEESAEFNGINMTYTEAENNESTNEVDSGVHYTAIDYPQYTKLYKYYRRADNLGLIETHKNVYYTFINDYRKELQGGNGNRVQEWYDGYDYAYDDGTTIDLINDKTKGLPGIAYDPVYSIEYRFKQHLIDSNTKDRQAALFALTAPRIYGKEALPTQAETLSEEEKKAGAFDVKEKQYALWELDGIQRGNDFTSTNDRNLGEISHRYQEFYDTIHDDQGNDEYGDKIVVSSGYQDFDKNLPDVSNVTKKEKTKLNLDGIEKEYDVYEYQDTRVEKDTQEECYVLGPFCVDYTIDDDKLDTYDAGGYEVKLNAIEKITVYNQIGKDISALGGFFKIAYSYNGEVTEANEAKVTRINNKDYYEFADGAEINGFDSKEEFYIVVYRGTMKPEDFTGFYAKIDFQYLENVTGTLDEYSGIVWEYKYIPEDSEYDIEYNGCMYEDVDQYDANGNYTGTTREHTTVTKKDKAITHKYTLEKNDLKTSHAQTMLAYHNDGWRYYKRYSIVLTSNWEEEKPEFRIHKVCDTNGENLYGAKFKVTMTINGQDLYKNKIDTELTFTRKTDRKGMAYITTEDIRAKEVAIGTFTGTIKLEFEETASPAGHIKSKDDDIIRVSLNLKNGKIVGGGGLTDNKKNLEIDYDNNSAEMTIHNKEAGTPKIQIAKVDSNGKLIKNAYFEVHVSYTDPDGVKVNNERTKIITYGKKIDKKNNIIRGQTRNGVLDLTVEDFENMKYGFDIVGYSGRITLDIVEIDVDGAFSISSNSRDVTLVYIDGELVEYTEFTNKKVNIQYLYDSVLDNVYKYATGEIKENELNAYVRNYLEDWVRRQEKRTDLSYNDVLDWLVDYIEENGDDVMKTCAKITTEIVGRKEDIVQITVEDSIGELPDIPKKPTPQPDPLFMTVAGTVFLDESETKEGIQVNGNLDEGEELLSGVEVTLIDKKTNQPAVLVQKDGEIRTNPTMTDENGYYCFMGVDPFKEYYVQFKYNGIEYRATDSKGEKTYNSADWAVSSKGGEINTSARQIFKEVGSIGSKAGVDANGNPIYIIPYDYYAIQGIYTEINARVQKAMIETKKYPDINAIYNDVINNHKNSDPEIAKKIEYIKSSMVTAQAGHSSDTTDKTYPYYFGQRFILNENSINEIIDTSNDQVKFAGANIPLLQPGQMQIHLGLVERDSTDLSLITDIVNTRVSMNGYDTQYDLEEGLSGYHQYIYEEDYYYEKNENTNGVAYYTDDEVEYYMTYKTTIKNATLTDTAVVEVADYYNSKFSWANTYRTSKGNVLDGYRVYINGEDKTGDVTISDESRYGLTDIDKTNTSYVNKTTGDQNYKELFIKFNKAYMLDDDDVVTIYLTFKMDRASANLYNEIYTGRESSDYSKLWQIGNYAEINGYMTRDGYLDADSRPGNFVIEKYETAKLEYQEAYSNYVKDRNEDNARKLKLALGRLTDVREDDAWYVDLTLGNTGYVRELHGSVWEAITDEVKTATNLQAYDGLLTYIKENGLKDLRVELVELTDDGKQIVRGKTTTGENGDYTFTSYIAGNYVVRFIYGEQDKDIRGKTTNSVGETLQVNGQYYQSTKANPDTDKDLYWYATEEAGNTRYSDVYDDAKSRIEQINAKLENTENSTSSDYEYDGVLGVQTYTHKDVVYAYTSTLNLEIEYIQNQTQGNLDNPRYEYKIYNVDCGLTPRAVSDVNIDKYVSNIKIYLSDGILQLDANIDKDGNVTYLNDEIYKNTVLPNNNSITYRDGLIETLFSNELLNGATIEITYTLTVSNDGEYDTIKYIYSREKGNTPVAVVYYGEDYKVLPVYEGDRGEASSSSVYRDRVKGEDRIVYHEGNGENYSLEQYKEGNDERIEIRTGVTNIVDYIDPNLTFIQVNKKGEEINRDWKTTSVDEFNTYREKDQDIMKQYTTIIRATDNNKLYTRLLPAKPDGTAKETVATTLTLSKLLGTTSTETNEYEYSNLIEITRLHSDSGKVIDIEGYDATGKVDTETSYNRKPGEMKDLIYPTLKTSKSETVTIHEATGLSISEQAKSNLGIVLIVLVILAVGIVLIKKFVLKPKTE